MHASKQLGVSYRLCAEHTERPADVLGPALTTTTSTATSFGGGGRNADRGGGRPRWTMKSLSQRPRPGASYELQRCAACHGTRRSARITRLPGLTKRLTSHVVIPNGRVRHHFEGTARETETGPRRRERPPRRVDRTDSSSTRRAVDAAQSRQRRRQCLRRRGAPNDYRVDATPIVASGSRTRWTIATKQVMGATVTRFLRPVTYRRFAAYRTTPVEGPATQAKSALRALSRRGLWDECHTG